MMSNNYLLLMADIDVIESERGIHVKLPLTWVPVFFVYSLFCPEKFLETISMDNHTKNANQNTSFNLCLAPLDVHVLNSLSSLLDKQISPTHNLMVLHLGLPSKMPTNSIVIPGPASGSTVTV